MSEYSIDTLVDAFLESGTLYRENIKLKKEVLKFIPELEKVFGPNKDVFETSIEVKKARIGLSENDGL